jgi:hypothetical protein
MAAVVAAKIRKARKEEEEAKHHTLELSQVCTIYKPNNMADVFQKPGENNIFMGRHRMAICSNSCWTAEVTFFSLAF